MGWLVMMILVYALGAVLMYSSCEVEDGAPVSEKIASVVLSVVWPITWFIVAIVKIVRIIKRRRLRG